MRKQFQISGVECGIIGFDEIRDKRSLLHQLQGHRPSGRLVFRPLPQ
jgi:hypothetical protein